MKLLSMRRSTQPGKKYTVVLDVGEGRTKTIHFGDASMKDYTLFSAQEREERKRAYLSRHAAREDWNDPTTAGFWSRHVLWGVSPSISENLKWTRNRYNL